MPVEVKTRMKIRRVAVRGPVLKLLLGRQLAGPTKDALKMRALGRTVSIAGVPGLSNVATDGRLTHR